MAFNPLYPTDNGLLINAPGQIRANWDALVLMTDSTLLINNGKVATDAGIEESKLLFSGSGHGHEGGTDGAQLDLTKAVTGILPLAHGGTGSSVDLFKTGDWVFSTVATARSGWTNVSATYANKFIRINATPLTTGGVDAHTHAVGSYAGPSHTHTGTAHTHDQNMGTQGFIEPSIGGIGGGWASAADGDNSPVFGDGATYGTSTHYQIHTGVQSGGGGATGAGGTEVITGTSASSSNVPAYVQVNVFQKS